ncbi:peptide chain release factor 2 [Veillonella criceti]|nr:peptide chain release factor 2 [Veillonella criceti]
MLEDLKGPIDNLEERIYGMGIHFNIAQKEDRIFTLDVKMSDPEFWNDPESAKEISQEATQLKDAVEGYKALVSEIEDVKLMLDMAIEEQDSSMESELAASIQQIQEEVERREVLLLLSGEYDTNNAILTFHAGAGGTEAQDWVSMLIRMYLRWAEQHGFTITMMDEQPGDEAGIKSATFLIKGENAFGYLKSEKGVHRLVRISPFDANARRHTSFAAVDVMPEIDDTVDIQLDMKDVRVDTYRASGAGGQHINKTDSAIRMTHIPTGIVVQCQSERSQIQNREQALKLLRAKLFELELEKQAELKEKIGGTYQAIEWGSQIRSYVFHPYNLVKDHRTGVETGNIQSVMDGNLDAFMEGFLKKEANLTV